MDCLLKPTRMCYSQELLDEPLGIVVLQIEVRTRTHIEIIFYELVARTLT